MVKNSKSLSLNNEINERLDPQDKLEEILSSMAFRCAGGITHSGRKEYEPAKQAILQWVADEMVGKDMRLYEHEPGFHSNYENAQNQLREKQRQILKNYGFIE